MANWRERLELNAVIGRAADNLEDEDAVPVDILQEIRQVLAQSKVLSTESLLENLSRVRTGAEFNRWLEDLYDEADRQLVWLGF